MESKSKWESRSEGWIERRETMVEILREELTQMESGDFPPGTIESDKGICIANTKYLIGKWANEIEMAKSPAE